MKGKTTNWLIWSGIILLLAAEVAFLWLGRGATGSGSDPITERRSKLPVTRLTEHRSNPVIVASPPAQRAEDVAAAIPDAPTDPLSLDALRQRVQPLGAIPQEALLTFRTPQALAAFLRGVMGGGLRVKDRLDELLTLRVGFDSLEQLRSQLLKGGQDGPDVSANYAVAVPRVPPVEQRGQGGDVPFGDSVLASIGIGADVDRSKWGVGVTVAVVDSGVGEHPAFRLNQVTHVDLVNDGKPFEGHGTAIASLIAGGMDGAQGVAPGATILDVRVANAAGESDSFLLAQGIMTAVDHGVKVINVSMGSYGDASVVQAAVQKALDRGITVVAAAGNEQASVIAWPAAYQGVISVTGVDASGQLAYFSNTGNPTIAAPGVGIPSAYYQNDKAYLALGSGTSQSAALVSGAVAAIMSQGGNVRLTLSRNASPSLAPASAVGAGILRLPSYR